MFECLGLSLELLHAASTAAGGSPGGEGSRQVTPWQLMLPWPRSLLNERPRAAANTRPCWLRLDAGRAECACQRKLRAESQRGEVPLLGTAWAPLVLLVGQGWWPSEVLQCLSISTVSYLNANVLGMLLSCKVLHFSMCTLHGKMVKDQQVINKGTHHLLLLAFNSLHPTSLLSWGSCRSSLVCNYVGAHTPCNCSLAPRCGLGAGHSTLELRKRTGCCLGLFLAQVQWVSAEAIPHVPGAAAPCKHRAASGGSCVLVNTERMASPASQPPLPTGSPFICFPLLWVLLTDSAWSVYQQSLSFCPLFPVPSVALKLSQ